METKSEEKSALLGEQIKSMILSLDMPKIIMPKLESPIIEELKNRHLNLQNPKGPIVNNTQSTYSIPKDSSVRLSNSIYKSVNTSSEIIQNTTKRQNTDSKILSRSTIFKSNCDTNQSEDLDTLKEPKFDIKKRYSELIGNSTRANIKTLSCIEQKAEKLKKRQESSLILLHKKMISLTRSNTMQKEELLADHELMNKQNKKLKRHILLLNRHLETIKDLYGDIKQNYEYEKGYLIERFSSFKKKLKTLKNILTECLSEKAGFKKISLFELAKTTKEALGKFRKNELKLLERCEDLEKKSEMDQEKFRENELKLLEICEELEKKSEINQGKIKKLNQEFEIAIIKTNKLVDENNELTEEKRQYKRDIEGLKEEVRRQKQEQIRMKENKEKLMKTIQDLEEEKKKVNNEENEKIVENLATEIIEKGEMIENLKKEIGLKQNLVDDKIADNNELTQEMENCKDLINDILRNHKINPVPTKKLTQLINHLAQELNQLPSKNISGDTQGKFFSYNI